MKRYPEPHDSHYLPATTGVRPSILAILLLDHTAPGTSDADPAVARKPRLFAPGLLYHVIARGNRRQPIFLGSSYYHAYLARLTAYRTRYRLMLYAYCLMPNHLHLLLETSATPLSVFMQGLQQSYTQHFNRTHGTVGHLFQGRYKATNRPDVGVVEIVIRADGEARRFSGRPARR